MSLLRNHLLSDDSDYAFPPLYRYNPQLIAALETNCFVVKGQNKEISLSLRISEGGELRVSNNVNIDDLLDCPEGDALFSLMVGMDNIDYLYPSYKT